MRHLVRVLKYTSMCFFILLLFFREGLRFECRLPTTDEERDQNECDIEPPVRFIVVVGRWHLKMSVLIALFVIPGGIRNGILTFVIYIIQFPLTPGKQLVYDVDDDVYFTPCRVL